MCSHRGYGAGDAEHASGIGVGAVLSGSISNQTGICHLHHYLPGPADPVCPPGCHLGFCLAPYPTGQVKRRMVVLLHMQHPCCHVAVETAWEDAIKHYVVGAAAPAVRRKRREQAPELSQGTQNACIHCKQLLGGRVVRMRRGSQQAACMLSLG